jgi:hypothetical protein
VIQKLWLRLGCSHILRITQRTSTSNMSSKGTFSFDTGNTRQTKLDDGVHLCIKITQFAIARVYFVSDQSGEIGIPEGLTIFDKTNRSPVIPLRGTQSFALCWTDSYTISYNGETVFDLINQRQWSVHGSPNREILTIEP